MKRHILSVLAVAAIASVAGAQQTPAQHDTHAAAPHKTAKHSAMRHETSSSGDVSLGGAGYSAHATSRDWVRADDTQGDDLYRREQMMDRKCGKSRERCGKA